VIANHMLYHIPDKPALLAEIQRILKPGGHFYASTIGGRHLAEIVDLITRFDRALSAWNRPTNSFTLENGAAQLAPWFNQVNLYRYEDNLEVTDAAALSDYILSMWMDLIGDRINQFRAFVDAEVAAPGGVFHITKDSGIFTSTR
jgi:2-polyprenyl-3-methyl-5-hydroxy-6-metoxy-1,4-benzoquinol methylase